MIRRTKSGLPKYCTCARDRHGKERIRFRKGGVDTYLSGTPWSPDFMREYGAALDGIKTVREAIGASRTKPGSVSALVVQYYRSPEFRSLRPSTRQTYRGIIERFRSEFGDYPVRGLKRAHISAIIGAMNDRPQAANNLLRLLKMLLNFSVEIGMVPKNPAVGVKGFKSQSLGFHTWTEDEISAFEAVHPIGTRPRLAFDLMLYTGQRRGDAVRMGWQHIRDGRIAVRQQKTGKSLKIRIHPALQKSLESLPRDNLTFLVTAHGAPFTPAGFGNWFRECCDAASLKNCSAHNLRKAAARRLAEAGNSANAIAAVTGHTTLKEVERYTRDADQALLADRAIATLPGGENDEQKLSNHPNRLDKTRAKRLK